MDERLFDRLEHGELALTEPLLLEMRYGARGGRDFALLAEELDALRLLKLDDVATRRALDAQAQLAAEPAVSHRVKPIELLVAAVAERHGADVLHCDSDYELLADRTDLAFGRVWAAARGSIS